MHTTHMTPACPPALPTLPTCLCRLKRIQELQAAAARPRFGTLDEISSNDFVLTVTEASHQYWVVCFLYKASHAGCQLLEECLVDLARQYPNTRFVKIISTSCIPNYPDQNLPTLLLYHDGGCVKHLVGLGLFGGRHATPEQVALVLNTYGQVCSSSSGEDEAAEGGGSKRTEQQQIKGLVQRLVAQREAEREEADLSSDFDSQ
jgi:thioredoxin-like negative regulator of GroEL